MPAAEDVERQIAVAAVIAVEEPALLLAVQRIVGGVEIEDDLLRRCLVRLEEQRHEQPLNGGRVVADLVIAGRQRPAQLQPVQRALAGNRTTVPALRRKLARKHRHHRIVTQRVVVVQILVTQRQTEYPLADQRRNLMLDQRLEPRIAKAPGEPANQADRPVRRSEKQRTGIRRDRSTVETRNDRPAF